MSARNTGEKAPTNHRLQKLPPTILTDAERGVPQPVGLGESDLSLGIEYGSYTGLSSSDVRVTVNKLTGGLLGALVDLNPINDTREFLKTAYQADLKTRNVQKLAARLQTIIRGYGGRIDSSSINADNATLDFVVPKSLFKNFRSEIKDLVPKRFLSETEQSQNLLPQKQTIETALTAETGALNTLKSERQTLKNYHDQSIAQIQNKLIALSHSLAVITQGLASAPTTTAAYQAQIQERARLSSNQSLWQQRLYSENQTFAGALTDKNNQINEAELELKTSHTEDQQLLNNVATINGSITIEWISIFEIIQLYVPTSVLLLITFGAFGIWHLTRPRRIFDLP